MSIRRETGEALPEQEVITEAILPSLGALSLDVHGSDPTGAGTARRQRGEICTLGTKGWGICIGPTHAAANTSKAIPVSNNPDERTPSVVPCIGGIYKLLRNPGLSNGIIYESDYLGNGHMCCVISDNTQYTGINRLYTAIETVLDIRTLLAQNDGPRAISGAKALRERNMNSIFYAEPKPQVGAPRTMTAYATSVKMAFGNMLAKKQEDEAERADSIRRGMTQEASNQVFEADTANRAWKNINMFVRLTSSELNRIFWFDRSNPDNEMRANNRAVFAQHYLYMGTWQLVSRSRLNGNPDNPGIVIKPTTLDNNTVHDTLAMHELSNHVRTAGSQAEALVVQALTQLSSPEYAGNSDDAS